MSIFTSFVILRHESSSPFSQVCASSGEFDLDADKLLVERLFRAGCFDATTIALNTLSITGFGGPAGANRLCQCSVPTPATPPSAIVGTSG